MLLICCAVLYPSASFVKRHCAHQSSAMLSMTASDACCCYTCHALYLHVNLPTMVSHESSPAVFKHVANAGCTCTEKGQLTRISRALHLAPSIPIGENSNGVHSEGVYPESQS